MESPTCQIHKCRKLIGIEDLSPYNHRGLNSANISELGSRTFPQSNLQMRMQPDQLLDYNLVTP